MSANDVLVWVLFLVPGFIGVQVYQHQFMGSKMPPLHTTAWSLLLSLAGVTPWLAIPGTHSTVAYVLHPADLSALSVAGFWLQVASSVGVALGLAWILQRVSLFGRFLMPTAWDILWSRHSREQRIVTIETEVGTTSGKFVNGSDSSSAKQDVLLREPHTLDPDGTWRKLGSEFAYFTASEIKRLQVSYPFDATRATSGEEKD